MDIRSVNLNLLVALEALLSERSVTRAARKTGVTQPAMSHSLAQLRRLFGDDLLVRGGHLTPFAESLIDGVERGLRELQGVLDAREPFDPAVSERTFRIAVSDAFQITSLHHLVEELRVRAPRVSLVVRPQLGIDLRQLAEGKIDVAIASPGQLPKDGLLVQELYRERFVCIVRRDNPSVGRRLTLAAFCRARHALVTDDEEPGYVDRALLAHGRSRHVALRLPDYAGLGHLIAFSDLLATVPERAARAFEAVLPIRVLTPPLPFEPFPIVAAWHRRFDSEPGSAWLRERIAEHARAH